jgi:phosphotransferase system  glucose/maltose/N-acetylglucosamine-specific IIC component
MGRIQQALLGGIAVIVMQVMAGILLGFLGRLFPFLLMQSPPTGLQWGLSGLILVLFYALIIYVILRWRERLTAQR